MKFSHLILGITLVAAGSAVALADTTPPATGTPPASSTAAPAPSATPDSQGATQTPPADGQTPAASDKPDPNEKICKRDDTTGSRLSKVCKTRKEWEEQGKGDTGGDF